MWQRAWALLDVFILLSSMLAWSAATARPVFAAPGVADPDDTLIIGPVGNVSVDDGVDIVVQARDDTPADLTTGGDDVALSSDLDGALSVTDNDDGTYSAHLDDTSPRTHTISGTINGDAITSGDATVVFTPGAADPSTTSIDAAPPTINVDIGTSAITVTAKDQFGNPLDEGGDTVTLATDGGDLTPVTTPTDNGDGTYSATLTDTVTGIDTVTGTINSTAITDDATVDFTPGALHHFVFGPIGGQTAGDDFGFTVTAYDQHNNIKTDYEGPEADAVLSGLATSPGCTGCTPALDALDFDDGTLSWDAGVGTATGVIAYDADAASVLTITDSTGQATVDDDSAAFAVGHAATLAGFTVDTVVDPQVAGTAFQVVVTAYDAYGNVKTNHNSASVSGLAASPGCPAPDCSPAVAAAGASPGSFSWSNGIGTNNTVVARNSQTSASVTVSDVGATNTSNTFTVNPASATRLLFRDSAVSFNGRPIDTKVSQPIYSVCVPPGASGNPCGVPPASTETKVLAIDAFGNRVDGVSVTMSKSPGTGTLAGTLTVSTQAGTPGVAPFGEAFFADLSISLVNDYTLTASSAGVLAASADISIVNDLEACDNQVCDNNTSNTQGPLQKAFGKITTGTDFFTGTSTNVLLSTQFVAGSEVTGRCGSNQTIGQATDMVVAGAGAAGTAPTSTMVLVMPKDTLKAFGITSRGTPSFNVCLGAIDLTGLVPVNAGWKQKGTGKKPVPVATSKGAEGRFWGTPADCGTAGLSASDPCILLRTKQAAEARAALGMTTAEFAALGIKDADLVIIVRKGSPWDGKGGSY